MLFCTVLYCSVLCCTVLYCAVLCCTVLCNTVLYFPVLYCCTVLLSVVDGGVCRVRGVESMEELQDVYQHFLLYYSQDLGKMKTAVKAARKKQRELRRLEREATGADDDDADDDVDDEAADTAVKHATRKSGYSMCIDAGLGQSLQSHFSHVCSTCSFQSHRHVTWSASSVDIPAAWKYLASADVSDSYNPVRQRLLFIYTSIRSLVDCAYR